MFCIQFSLFNNHNEDTRNSVYVLCSSFRINKILFIPNNNWIECMYKSIFPVYVKLFKRHTERVKDSKEKGKVIVNEIILSKMQQKLNSKCMISRFLLIRKLSYQVIVIIITHIKIYTIGVWVECSSHTPPPPSYIGINKITILLYDHILIQLFLCISVKFK